MTTRVTAPAVYVIRQHENGELKHEETMPESTPRIDVIARAEQLEEAQPERVTTWFLRGATTEEVYMSGSVDEVETNGEYRFFDISGAEAVSAELDGESVGLVFVLRDEVVPGSVFRVYDADGEQIAEEVL